MDPEPSRRLSDAPPSHPRPDSPSPSPTHCRLCHSPPPPCLRSSRIQPLRSLPWSRRRRAPALGSRTPCHLTAAQPTAAVPRARPLMTPASAPLRRMSQPHALLRQEFRSPRPVAGPRAWPCHRCACTPAQSRRGPPPSASAAICLCPLPAELRTLAGAPPSLTPGSLLLQAGRHFNPLLSLPHLHAHQAMAVNINCEMEVICAADVAVKCGDARAAATAMPPVQGSFGCRPTPLGQSLARPRGFGRRLDARPRVGERGRGRVLQLFFSRAWAWARAAESAAKLWPARAWARVGGGSNQTDP